MPIKEMTIKKEDHGDRVARGTALLAAGGLLGALAASSCCILPLVLFSVGVSGAWIGHFTRLAPYQPIFIAATLACLGAGAWLVYRAPKRMCAEGEVCARPLPRRLVEAALVIAALLVATAVGFALLGPLLFNS
jgi:mercuric ion transport protein